jgi:cytochrome c biogenesis protein CcdA
MLNLALAWLAGILSTLSPCVLPILPIIVSSALQDSKKSLFALVIGLALAFALMGSVITYLALSVGFDTRIIQQISAVLLLAVGLILVSKELQQRFVILTAPLVAAGNVRIADVKGDGVAGQFGLGMLLGLVWVPCVGPTLGAAISLATAGDDIGFAFLTMLMFGVGAGLPLLAIGLISGKFTQQLRGGRFINRAKQWLGGVLIVIALLVISGVDKVMEAYLLDLSPDWLLDLTTAI